MQQTSLNNAQTKIDADGGVRIVISKKDPGVANWLDTTGRAEGTFVLRNYNATSAPVPTTRKVKFSELAKALPAGTTTVSPEQRWKDTEYRRDGYTRFFGE